MKQKTKRRWLVCYVDRSEQEKEVTVTSRTLYAAWDFCEEEYGEVLSIQEVH